MNIYLAARYGRFQEMQGYAQDIRSLGHAITSRWILGDHDFRAHGQSEADYYMPLWGKEDFDDLLAADMCISFTEGPGNIPGRSRGGRHVEHGIALALGKRCVVINFRENVFHWLPTVEFYASWKEVLAMMSKEL